MEKAASAALVVLVKMLWWTAHAFFGYGPGVCRFTPSCGDYALAAARELPPAQAVIKISWRLLRCSPLCSGGYDPVILCDKKRSRQK